MLMAFTLLSLLTRIPLGFTVLRTCVPNTIFQVYDKVCLCDARGRWTESNCHTRRQTCQPGQIIWNNCSQCICDENGQQRCTYKSCNESATRESPDFHKDYFEAAGLWCTPFKSYYVNCSLCICPASGRTAEARCAADTSCSFKGKSPESLISTGTVCIPTVMYLFPCMQCLCSDEGYFVPNECVETCHKSKQVRNRRCIPGTFYRKDCNVCLCPESSSPNEEKCTSRLCDKRPKFKSLRHFKNKISKCTPYKFTKPRCHYCMCNANGELNEDACLELECLKTADFKYDVEKFTCSPGEMVPLCIECFCPQNGLTDKKYCTNVCSFQSKLVVLEKMLEESVEESHLINRAVIKKSSVNLNCEPNSLYLDKGRYCLCPENGNINLQLCTTIADEIQAPVTQTPYATNAISVDFNTTCEPNTFVDFDCNTCYCSKNGKIDPKWCTYDDCHSKRVIQKNHKEHNSKSFTTKSTDTCNPGSISKEECNFCICPESGIFNERACTKNDCSDIHGSMKDQKFFCEPLSYYIVDCNVCFCPKDGLKNLAKCTKNQCDKIFLRSDTCNPGDLFSEDCNVCLCPPNGVKADKACTSYSCNAAKSSWQRIFKLSQSLLGSRMTDGSKRSIHLCFPGEEFADGCKVCVCPDQGLREYATCTPMFCNENTPGSDVEISLDKLNSEDMTPKTKIISRRNEESCMTYNLTDSSERKECTPGSLYIIRCRQCICPYMGNINYFCRPLPPNVYCEQAFPNFNYLPMGRRNTDNSTQVLSNRTDPKQITISHNHTKYSCDKPGKIQDECFVCDCEGMVVIEEHCFKSDAANCTEAKPSFLHSVNKIVTQY